MSDGITGSPVRVMGVVNVTDDSFSDGGRYLDAEELGGRQKTGELQEGSAGDGHQGSSPDGYGSGQVMRPMPQKKTPAKGLPVLNLREVCGL